MAFFYFWGHTFLKTLVKLNLHNMGPLMFDHLFLCFSTALLRFLVGHEVDPDWTCHVRLLCVSQRPLSAANSAHMCFGGPHTAAFSVRWTVCVCDSVPALCLFMAPPTRMTMWSSVSTSSNGYLMFPAARALRWCPPGWSVVVPVHLERT